MTGAATTAALPPLVQAKFDPYLLAGLQSQFAHYDDRADGGDAPLISVGFTLVLPASAAIAQVLTQLTQWLAAHSGCRITQAHLRPLSQGGRTAYVTADVNPVMLLLLGAAPWVTEVQLCANLRPRRPLATRPRTPASVAAPPLRTANKRILATIDHGCAFAHAHLRQGDGTRVWALWDQDVRPDFAPAQGSTPTGYGYGRQIGQEVLNAYMARATAPGGLDEDQCYALAGYGAVRPRMTHGSWVMGLLGGAMASPSLSASGRSEPCPDAQDADLIFVQLPRAIPLAPGLGCIDRALLDGLRYIADCAPDDAEVAVVIDYGTDMGPHDGTSWFERALDALTEELRVHRNVRLNAFCASGNAHEAHRHAVIWGHDSAPPASPPSPAQPPSVLPWWLPMGSAAPMAMELWFSEAAPPCQLTLQPPGGGAALNIPLERNWLGTPSGLLPAQGVVVSQSMRGRPDQPAQRQVLITVGPTQGPDNDLQAPAAPAGVWRLTLTPNGSQPVQPVHAYTCWGGQGPGVPQRAYASRFVAPPPGIPSTDPVRVTGTGSLLGSGCGDSNQVWMAGGYEGWGVHRRARYTSAGAARGGKRAGPLGLPPHAGADWLAVTEQSVALPGLLMIGTRSASRSRGRGTSFAAPQAARKWLANTLATQAPPLSPQPGADAVERPRDEYGEPRIE